MDYQNLLDEYGLLKNNSVLAVYFPSVRGFVPFRVLYRENQGYEKFNYGPLPVSFPGYEAGVIPAGQTTDSITFPYYELPEEQRVDMFYYTEPGRLIHAHIYISPILLRGLVEIPKGSKTYSYLDKVTQDLTKDFGFFRGYKEMIFLPKIHIGWKFYNPTNLDLRTNLHIVYGEYRVELVKEADVIYEIMTKKHPAYWIVYGGKYRFIELDDALKVYGIPSADYVVPLLPDWFSKAEAINIIKDRISLWRVR